MGHPRLGLRQTIANRRRLRASSTAAEEVLWKKLRAKRLEGFRFRRQYGIGPYIVDFCCRSRNLVIEVDGDVHAPPEQVQIDKVRQEKIEALGYRVLRYTNGQVMENLENVLEDLWNHLQTSPSPPP